MNVADGLDIGPGFVNARMNPKFCVRPAVAGKLIAVDVEHEQVVFAHQRWTHARRKNESVCAGNARADVAEGRGDALPVENMAGGDDVLFDVVETHGSFSLAPQLPYDSRSKMSIMPARIRGRLMVKLDSAAVIIHSQAQAPRLL